MTPRPAGDPDDLASREVLLSISGLEFMLRVLDGRLPMAAISGLMDQRVSHVERGLVRFRATPAFAHTNPFGAVHGGWYGTLLDSVLGCAVMTEVPEGSWYTTLEYKVNLTRSVPIGADVEAEARVRHAGRTTAVAEGEIRGVSDGRLYATGSTTCLIMRG